MATLVPKLYRSSSGALHGICVFVHCCRCEELADDYDTWAKRHGDNAAHACSGGCDGRQLCLAVQHVPFPIDRLRIDLLSCWNGKLTPALWHVRLSGTPAPSGAVAAHADYLAARGNAELLLATRARGLFDAHAALAAALDVRVEHPLLTRLFDALVRRGDTAAAESALADADAAGLFDGRARNEPPVAAEWQRVPAARQWPSGRGGHQLCFDGASRSLLLFGGWTGERDLNDVHQFDLATRTWRLLHDGSGDAPSPRSCHKIAYDAQRRLLYTIGRYVEPSDERAARQRFHSRSLNLRPERRAQRSRPDWRRFNAWYPSLSSHVSHLRDDGDDDEEEYDDDEGDDDDDDDDNDALDHTNYHSYLAAVNRRLRRRRPVVAAPPSGEHAATLAEIDEGLIALAWLLGRVPNADSEEAANNAGALDDLHQQDDEDGNHDDDDDGGGDDEDDDDGGAPIEYTYDYTYDYTYNYTYNYEHAATNDNDSTTSRTDDDDDSNDSDAQTRLRVMLRDLFRRGGSPDVLAAIEAREGGQLVLYENQVAIQEQTFEAADFWCFDVDARQWRCLSRDTEADGGPALLYDHQMCFNADGSKLFVFGGRVVEEAARHRTEHRVLSAAQLLAHVKDITESAAASAPAPPLVSSALHAAAVRAAIIVQLEVRGSHPPAPAAPQLPLAAVVPVHTTAPMPPPRPTAARASHGGLHVYHVAEARWELLAVDQGSASSATLRSRIGHSMTYDARKNELHVLAGQRDHEYLGDHLVLDATTGRTVRLHRDSAQDGGPGAGFTQRAAVDAQRREIVLLSGLVRPHGSVIDLMHNSVWLFSLERQRWTKVRGTPHAPPPPGRGDFVGGVAQDVHAIVTRADAPPSLPPPRYAHAIAVDSARSHVWLFGGNPGAKQPGRLDDLWCLALTRRDGAEFRARAHFAVQRFAFENMCAALHAERDAAVARKRRADALAFLRSKLRATARADAELCAQLPELAACLLFEPASAAPTPVSRRVDSGDSAVRRRLGVFRDVVASFPAPFVGR